MTALIIITSSLIMLFGILFSAWTAMDTRKRYYKDFTKRKSEREKLRLP